jgi:hypothetical protein
VDFGDAPDTGVGTGAGNYNTQFADSGPYHAIVSGLNLGNVAPDSDTGGLQDAAATADNANNVNDEDGVTLPVINTGTSSVNMAVRATNSTATPAFMRCYIDFNRDGDFLDPGEGSGIVNVPANSGGANYSAAFSGFAFPSAGATYIRCRIGYVSSEVNSPTGVANSGEVEDYRVDTALSVTLASFDAASQAGHVLVAWETVSEASNAGFNLYRSLTADGQRTLLAAVPSQAPGGTQGAAYSFQDADVSAGQTYWYWLEDISLSGAATLHGPVSVAYQAPTAVTLSGMAADGGPMSGALPWLAAALLAAGVALVVWRRKATV